MSTTKKLTIGLALVLTVALGMAATSAATAGTALTKSVVKKLAAKVVAKKAPTLSVAHATTADTATNATNATTVGGVAAAALQTSAYSYTLPVQASVAGSRTYTFPDLTPGTYLVSYNLQAIVAANAWLICWMKSVSNASPNVAHNYGQNIGGSAFSRISTTAIITTTPTTTLNCNGNGGVSGAWQLDAQSTSASTVTFVPIDNPVSRTATGARGVSSGDANR